MNDGTCEGACLDGNLLPVDSFGVVVQSIGGGGGMGGTASAQAVAISFPVTPTEIRWASPWGASVGGSGGEGGDGNYVTFAATEGAQITTSGQGAHGVMIQSIGGGGGTGGDSSALAAVYGYGESVPEGAASLAITPTFSLGGSGATAGNGGPVWTAIGGKVDVHSGVPSFTADGPNSAVSQVTTYGDYANAIHAQSIGGGGGNAGMGSGPTQTFGTGSSISAAINLGGTGGAGGNGDEVRVEAYPLSRIRTFGSNAAGILAHSIGGGGGASQGGAINVAAFEGMKSGSLSIAVGRTGGAGGKGGPVTVNVGGSITTDGADAAGVHAQSIGGGGGVGGSAGSEASADNPVLEVFEARHNVSRIKELIEGSVMYGGSLNLSVGGQGGAGNTADAVAVNLTPGASIQTNGDWSMGVMAQSIGGGGGKGGVAAASGEGSLTRVQINANISVGGSGGAGAHGGNVQSTLDSSTIKTAGHGATGVFLHSVGGGGGWGADGSDGSWGELAVGKSLGGSGGRGGNGGVVVLTTNGSNFISTQNEAAFGTLLQSVGGSGGFAGAGSRLRAAPLIPSEQRMRLVGGDDENQEAGGTGGAVALNDTGGLQVATAGNNAIAVMVQSVGGGGGIVANAQSQVEDGDVDARIYSTSSSEASDGGEVSVNLAGAAAIRTSGKGAHGVVAQTVGGGGGLIGLPGSEARLAIMPAASPDDAGGHGRGGNVTVHNAGVIEVQGKGAVGILAQSVSGGGGLLLDTDGQTVLAGSASRKGSSSAKVEVRTSGRVASTGPDGIGLFAQNVGGAGVQVQLDGEVVGGSGTGMGVWVDSSAPSTLNTGSGGSVQAASGNAIYASNAPLNVVNQGTISGSVDLAQGSMDNRGTLNAGAEFKGQVHNSGTFALGSPLARPLGAVSAAASTVITGDFHQTSTGTLRISPDFSSPINTAMLHVTGDAVLDGRLDAQPVALLPGRELHVMSVAGKQSGTLRVQSSPVIQYSVRQDAQHTYVQAASASFDTEAMQLTGNPLSIAQHIQKSWDNGGSARLAPLYASFDQASREGAGSYRSKMAELSPALAMAPAAQTQLAMGRFTDAMMSCPVYVGQGTALSEQDCVWGEVTGRWADQDGTNGSAGYSYDTVNYQFGGQRRIAPNWVLGASMAYQTSKLRSDNGKTRGSGDTGYLGMVLKRESGPWTFSAALAGSYGSHDVSRRVTIPAAQGSISSSPDVYGANARLRAARNFDHGIYYIKPYVDLTAHYARMPGYSESDGVASLEVDSSDQFVAGLTPALEVGGRLEMENGMILRPFAYAGVSLYTDTDWKMKARLRNAPPATGSFTTVLPGDNVVGRVGAGLHLMKVGGIELRAQYDGEFASKGNSHSASLRLNVPF